MESHTALTLQEDDTALAYEFARKFPGYTADKQFIYSTHMHSYQAPHRASIVV